MKSPHGPTKYLGPTVFYAPTVTVNRRPLTTDLYQPTTGKYYFISTIWQVGKNPTDGVEGEMYILTKIVANVAYWEIFTGGSTGGTVTGLADSAGTQVGPDSTGIINTIGDTNSIITTLVDGILDNTIRVIPKFSEVNATSAAGKAGVASFLSTQFSADSNGFISLKGGSTPGILLIQGSDGINIGPDSSGIVQLTAGVVQNGVNTVPVYVKNISSNHDSVQVQFSTADAATHANNAGLSSFSSAQFDVDTNGFVTLKGGSTASVLFLQGNDGTNVGPDASGITYVTGSTVANATNATPLYFKNTSSNHLTAQLQIATTVSPTPANTNSCGICCFDVNQFDVDTTSGMVSLKGSSSEAPILGVLVDTGFSPVVPNPVSGNISILGGLLVATGTLTNKATRSNGIAANTVGIDIQLAGSNASTSDSTKYGVCQFDSRYYSVTTGYVTDALASDTFYAYLSADTSNQTGDGTQYTIPFDTKTGTGWDANGNFTTGAGALYTTPIQGEYEFEASVRVQASSGDLAAHTRCVMWIWATNGSGTDYQICEFGNFTGSAASVLTDAPNPDGITLSGATRMRLPAGYKVTVRVSVDGVSKNVYIGGLGGATKVTYFSGRCVSVY